MLMVGGIEPAVGEVFRAKDAADDNQGGSGQACGFYRIADIGQSAAQHLLIWPNGAIDHGAVYRARRTL